MKRVTLKNLRDVNGIFLLDKSAGVTSNQALQKVKCLFNARKAGHTGSLDPIATGMLPICMGRATRDAHALLNADKSYVVIAQLGVRTSTADSEGEIIAQMSVPIFPLSFLRSAVLQFYGAIQQVPPMYSALKHKGQPLYKLARQGICVAREPRSVVVHQIELLDYHNDHTCILYVRCSKGTYIRTIIDDLGQVLKCGAHVITLRRLSVGKYDEDQMLTLSQLQHAYDLNGFEGLDSHLI